MVPDRDREEIKNVGIQELRSLGGDMSTWKFGHLTAGERVERFWREHSVWSQETFGKDTERGSIGALKHLEKEAREAQAKPLDMEEYADCFFLTIDSARRAGLTLSTLMDQVEAKFAKNRKRVWAKPTNADEPIEHVRGIHD
jgi:hypothetical protein